MFNLSNVDPIILDVAFIAILVLILFFGIIRGIKSVIINLIIVTVSVFLGFVKYTNDLKAVLLKMLKLEEWLPAGSTNTFKFSFELFSNFISSLLVTVIFFLVLKCICAVVKILLNRRNVNREKGNKSKVGRLFGGVLNLVYGFVLLMIVLFSANNNITGVGKYIERTSVTKKVVDFAETELNKINKDMLDMVVLKVYVGDILYDVDYEMIDSFKYVDEQSEKMLNGTNYVNKIDSEKWEDVAKDRIFDLYNMAVLANRFADNNPFVKDKFVKMYEEVVNAVEKNQGSSKIVINAEQYGIVKLAFSEKNLQLGDENIKRFENIVEIGQ